MSLPRATRLFEILFVVAVVTGVLSLQWPIVAVALAAACAVAVSRYACPVRPGGRVGLAEAAPAPGPAPHHRAGPAAAALAPGPAAPATRRPWGVEAKAGHTRREPRVPGDHPAADRVVPGACGPGAPGKALFDTSAYEAARAEAAALPNRIAARIALAMDSGARGPESNEVRAAFMRAVQPGNEASEYTVRVPGAEPCPEAPLDGAIAALLDQDVVAGRPAVESSADP